MVGQNHAFRRERRLSTRVALPLRFTRFASPDPRPSDPVRTAQLDKRGASVDAKIKQLDAELARHREILRTCRTPAAKELKKQFNSKAFDVDKLDALNDEMADLMDQSREIQDVLGRSYDVPEDIDEEELMGELDALEEMMGEEELDEEVPSYLRDEALPDAPDGTQEALPAAGEDAPVAAAAEPAQKSAAQ